MKLAATHRARGGQIVAGWIKSHSVASAVAFDRPGLGHGARPRGEAEAGAQADLVGAALAEIGVDRAIWLGLSWGCSSP